MIKIKDDHEFLEAQKEEKWNFVANLWNMEGSEEPPSRVHAEEVDLNNKTVAVLSQITEIPGSYQNWQRVPWCWSCPVGKKLHAVGWGKASRWPSRHQQCCRTMGHFGAGFHQKLPHKVGGIATMPPCRWTALEKIFDYQERKPKSKQWYCFV